MSAANGAALVSFIAVGLSANVPNANQASLLHDAFSNYMTSLVGLCTTLSNTNSDLNLLQFVSVATGKKTRKN